MVEELPMHISETDITLLADKWYRTALSSENSVKLAADVAEIAIRIAKREIASAWVCKKCYKINLRRRLTCSKCEERRDEDECKDECKNDTTE